jgi:hypothetical protein
MIGALLLITLGILFLLNNFGVISWEVWNDLWRFWPVILILIGLELLAGKSRLASFIVFLIGLVLLAMVIIKTAFPAIWDSLFSLR